MKPVLVADCFVNDPDGAASFVSRYPQWKFHSYRAVAEDAPASIKDYSAFFITGSAASVTSWQPWMDGLRHLVLQACQHQIPTLGVCFGHQIIGHTFGGAVRQAPVPEVGWVDMTQHQSDPLLAALPKIFSCFVSHEDEVHRLAPDLELLASSTLCPVHALRHRLAPIWGLQFHPEMSLQACIDLVQWRVARHGQRIPSAEQILKGAKSNEPIADAVFNAFGAIVTQSVR